MPNYNPNQWQYWQTPYKETGYYNTAQGQLQNWLNNVPNVMGLHDKMRSQFDNAVTQGEANYMQQQGQPQAQQFADIYGQAQKAYDPAAIAKIFANAYGQMGRSQGGAVANAQRTAAQHGASQSLLNPGAFIMGAGQQARAPYAEALSNLGQAESQAQMAGQKGLMETMYLLNRAKQGDKQAEAELELRRQQLELQRQQLQAQIDSQEAGFFDYLGAAAPIIGSLIAPGIGTAIGAGVGGGLSSGSGYRFGGDFTKLPWER